MCVVTEICIKYPGVRTRIIATDILYTSLVLIFLRVTVQCYMGAGRKSFLFIPCYSILLYGCLYF
jgi:hypothetical protein